MTTTLAAGERAVSDRLLGRAQEIGQAEMARLLARTPAVGPAVPARGPDAAVRRRVVVPEDAAVPDLRDPRARAATSGTRTAPSTSTSTAGSAPWWWATRTRGSSRRSTRRRAGGTHFAVTTESAVAFGEEICRRFNLEMLRFANSGTEATMDAIRVARAATGRDVVCKIEGSYHGHHDSVMFSIVPNADLMGGRDRPGSAPVSKGMVKDAAKYIEVVPFNDADHLERVLQERGQEIACLIMEPAMMNIGIVVPQPGYLAAGARAVHQARRRLHLRRDQDRLHHRRRAAPPSASACSPIWSASPRPSPAGCPAAAFGGREDLMRLIERGVSQMGTYNGNPLVVARRAGDAHRGADARRLPALRAHRHPARPGLPGRHRPPRPAGPHRGPRRQGLRLLPARPR